jgi:hypothetical protein
MRQIDKPQAALAYAPARRLLAGHSIQILYHHPARSHPHKRKISYSPFLRYALSVLENPSELNVAAAGVFPADSSRVGIKTNYLPAK